MKVRMDDNCPHRFWVSSESDSGVEYIVELAEFPLSHNEQGVTVFNGACGLTGERIHGCKHFRMTLQPQLKDPQNKGKFYRCKHVRAAREFALDFIVPHLVKADPNNHEDYTP